MAERSGHLYRTWWFIQMPPWGLGGQLEDGEYWGNMESGRTVNAHQLAGATSSLACYRSLYTREDKSEHPSLSGQAVGGSIYQPQGGHPFQQPASFGSGLWAERLSWKPDIYQVSRMCEQIKCWRYIRITWTGSCVTQHSAGSMISGTSFRWIFLQLAAFCNSVINRVAIFLQLAAFCNPVINTTGSILQLETETISGSSRCLATRLGISEKLREPPLVLAIESAEESSRQKATLVVVTPLWPTQPWSLGFLYFCTCQLMYM